jgi:hypothetical protein
VSIDGRIVAQRCGIEDSGLPLDGVRVVSMPKGVARVLGRHVQAITIVRTIMVNTQIFDSVVSGSEPELVAHELTHVAQWENSGILSFLWIYTRDYLRLRLLGATHDAAYRSIGFEHEAYSRASEIVRALP